MKKYLVFIIGLLFGLSFIGFSVDALIIDKIDFEGFDLDSSSSITEIKEKLLKCDEIEIVIKLDHDEQFIYRGTEVIEDDATYEEVEAHKLALRNAGKEFYQSRNKKVCNSFGLKDYEYCYVSMYSPYIEYIYNSEILCNKDILTLKVLSKNSGVGKIFIHDNNEKIQPMLTRSLNYAGAYTDFNEGNYTGAGVKIGLLDEGILDSDHQNISGSNYVNRDELLFFETESDHSLAMASVIGCNTGICPDATIYAVQLYGSMTGEMDWLINQGVDVINMSFGEESNYGVYDSVSAYVDLMVTTYEILCVVAAGNYGDTHTYIANPALAYNVLTVGAGYENELLCSYSSFGIVYGPNKPSLVASCDPMAIPNLGISFQGTSYSCAFVTGLVGLLMERYPALKTQPMKVITLLCANAREMTEYDEYVANGFQLGVGAGYIQYNLACDNYSNVITVNNTSTASGTVVVNRTITLLQGESVRVCMGSYTYTDGTHYSVAFTDYNLYVTNSNGLVTYAANNTSNCNLEIASYYGAAASTVYKIRVLMNSEKACEGAEKIYIAFSIIRTGVMEE